MLISNEYLRNDALDTYRIYSTITRDLNFWVSEPVRKL